MTKKLKDYLNKNRHILQDENYAELLANCPTEVVAELKLLLDDTGAKEEVIHQAEKTIAEATLELEKLKSELT